MKKTAIYYRVSTDKQDVDSQKWEVENWLRENNLKSDIVFSETISGAASHRPEYDKLMEMCARGKIGHVVVYKMDRFGRDAVRLLNDIMALEDMGINFIAVCTPPLNTINMPFRRVMLAMFAELAQLERQQIKDRIRAGIRAAKLRGVRFGRQPRITQEQKDDVFKLRDDGLSYRAIAAQVKIGRQSVARILTSN